MAEAKELNLVLVYSSNNLLYLPPCIDVTSGDAVSTKAKFGYSGKGFKTNTCGDLSGDYPLPVGSVWIYISFFLWAALSS